MQNCSTSTVTCITKMIRMIFRNMPITGPTLPSAPISRKMPKMNMGSMGMITLRITINTSSRSSSITLRRLSPLTAIRPRPTTNASTSDVVTLMTDGISIVKYGARSLAAMSMLPSEATELPSSEG